MLQVNLRHRVFVTTDAGKKMILIGYIELEFSCWFRLHVQHQSVHGK